MPDYRIYTVKEDGHLAGPPRIVECTNDEIVVQEARHLLEDQLLEIWQGPRVVMRLDPNQR